MAHDPLEPFRRKPAPEQAQVEPEPDDARARWENAKQLVIEAWQNVTWEQAQEHMTKAYNEARDLADAHLGAAAGLFVERFNRSVFESDTKYGAALHEFFVERLSQEAEPQHSLRAHEAVGMAIDVLQQIPDNELQAITGNDSNASNLLPVLEDVYEVIKEDDLRNYDIPRMSAAEIRAAIKHDLALMEAARQDKEPNRDPGIEPER